MKRDMFWARGPNVVDDLGYYRKDGKLFKKDSNGDIEINDDCYIKDMSNRNKGDCFGLGIDYTECTKLMEDCLAGNDVTKCKEMMTDPNYWYKINKEINELNIKQVQNLLNKFNVNQEKQHNAEAGVALYQYVSADDWVKYLKNTGKFSDSDINSINNNDKLKDFINIMSKRINSNPSILNSDYTGNNITIDPGFNKDTRYPNIPAAMVGPTVSDIYQSLAQLGLVIDNRRNDIRTYRITTFPQAMLTSHHQLTGGDFTIQKDLTNLYPMALADLFKIYYKKLEEDMKQHGKDFDKGTQSAFNESINELARLEEKLLKAFIYGDKAIELMGVYGSSTFPESVLTMDSITDILEKRNKIGDKTNVKQDELYKLLINLSSKLYKEIDPITFVPINSMSR